MRDPMDHDWYQASADKAEDAMVPAQAFPLSAEEAGPESNWVINRRSFLRATGFTLAGIGLTGTAMLSGCTPAPVKRAVPLLEGVEGQLPGKAQWYATVCGGCAAGCGTLAKVRDGRPIKLEGLPGHPVSQGGLCAMGQAHVLELYDSHRLTHPQLDGKQATWDAVDGHVAQALESIHRKGGAVRVVATALTSPSLRKAIELFLTKFENATLVEYDALSVSAIRAAHAETHGARLLPWYQFDKAQLVVSFNADFLGTWLHPVAFTRDWTKTRQVDGAHPTSSRVVQFEGRMSLTGTNADSRYTLTSAEIPHAIGRLALFVAQKAGLPAGELPTEPHRLDQTLQEVAAELWRTRGTSMVICGLNDLASQRAVNVINDVLGNYGTILDLDRPLTTQNGDDVALAGLEQELAAGQVDAIILLGANPVYDRPNGTAWAGWLDNTTLSISMAGYADESAAHCAVIAPDHHPLEAWSDAETRTGIFAIRQPTISPLHNTRSALTSLATWNGTPLDAQEALKAYWAEAIYPRGYGFETAETVWNEALSNGFVRVRVEAPFTGMLQAVTLAGLLPAAAKGLSLECYPTMAVGDGSHAQNPWLQELPDPISKVTWDNFASLSAATAAQQGVKQGDVIRVQVEGASVELPVYIQPGQHDDVVAVALGYGRLGTERFAEVGPEWIQRRDWQEGPVGKHIVPLLVAGNAHQRLDRSGVQLAATGAQRPLATTQQHHTLETPMPLLPEGSAKRAHILDTTLAALPAFLQHKEEHQHEHDGGLWPNDHLNNGPQWGMAIDLNACTGCSGCVVACQAENNIPVVGKDEVMRGREMHWLRLDRYYREDGDQTRVAHQPMLCQQCGNAPCETVCPVLATVHSEDGLNQQVYNRCVGTRYCANNCPYKVRRFNWFDYPHQDPIENLVLNPDVTVRSRGIMEKCTFCSQRIAEARIEARAAGRPIADGEIQPACAQSCPAQAITFGDMSDPESAVSKAQQRIRSHKVLAELNVKPSVSYQAIVRNPLGDTGGVHG